MKEVILKNAPILIGLSVLFASVITTPSAEAAAMGETTDVALAPNGIGIPLGRILLIRKGNEYGAVKFTQCWTGKTEYEQHAEYESYFLEGQTAKNPIGNMRYRKEEVYYTKPSFAIFGHPIRIGAKRDIRCGPIELWWYGSSCSHIYVFFHRHDQKQGDFYGIELAPTPWRDISLVNVFDPRIRWYRYDESRKDQRIPIDGVWEEKK